MTGNRKSPEPDLNLLRAFEALYEERGVSRAAARLGVSQPAVSRYLRLLRGIFKDPLFHNTGRGLAPTAHAVALMPNVRKSLSSCRECFALFCEEGDVPASRQFVIGMSDDFEIASGNVILQEFFRNMRGMRVVFRQTNTRRVKNMLLSREIDIGVTAGGFDSLSLSRRIISPLADAVVVSADSCQENQASISVDEVVERPHLLIQEGGYIGTTDILLRSMGKHRTIQAISSHFGAVSYLVPGTRLAVNMPLHAARSICREGSGLKWFAQPLPVNVPNVEVGWRRQSEEDAVFLKAKDLLVEVLNGIRWS